MCLSPYAGKKELFGDLRSCIGFWFFYFNFQREVGWGFRLQNQLHENFEKNLCHDLILVTFDVAAILGSF